MSWQGFILHLFISCLLGCSWGVASLFLLEAFKGGGKGDGLAPNIEEPELWTVSDSDKLNDGKVIFSKL